jgi:general nucleoside transport system permease protein
MAAPQAPTKPGVPPGQSQPPAPVTWVRQLGGRIGLPLGSVIFAFLVGAIIVVLTGGDPVLAFQGLFCGGAGVFCTGSTYGTITPAFQISNTIVFATPLIFTGCSVALAFRAGLFNIGAQGQLTMGAIAAAWVGIHFAGWPAFLLVPAVLIAGTAAGAVWGGIVGILKAFTGAHEVVTTIMLNYIAFNFLYYLLRGGPMQLAGQPEISAPIGAGAQLPRFIPTTGTFLGQPGAVYQAHTGILIAFAVAALFYFLLRRTALGYELRAVGQNQRAARYAGISFKRTVIVTMLIAGAFSGLAGGVEIAGLSHNLTIRYATDTTGFDAIAVALLGQGAAIGIILSALLFAGLRVAGPVIEANANVSQNLVDVMEALILFSLAANFLRTLKVPWPWRRRSPSAADPPLAGAVLSEIESTHPAEVGDTA